MKRALARDLALDIVRRLQQEGYTAYFVGGWVRDWLLGSPHLDKQDIDIATSASPETVCQIFPKTLRIGEAFGIVAVLVDSHAFEVATFRKDGLYLDGRRPSSILQATAQEDAQRRDFTINGMFYDPIGDQLFDFVDGQADLKKKVVRTIGNPEERFSEDYLRLLRAIRYASRYNFSIDNAAAASLLKNASKLVFAVSAERIREELNKMSSQGSLANSLLLLLDFTLLEAIFPIATYYPKRILVKRIQGIKSFSKDIPAVVAILSFLFYDRPLDEKIGLARRLKESKKNILLIEAIDHHLSFLQRKPASDRCDWAYFYAEPQHEVALLLYAKLSQGVPPWLILLGHRIKKWRCRAAIARIQKNDFPLQADDFFRAGIAPGRVLGLLLKEMRRICINQKINNSGELLNSLKKSNIWPR